MRSVSDIDALATVNEIEELRIEASDLRDLEGLECITRVGNLYIERNPELESLDGLEGLSEVVGPFDSLGGAPRGEFFIRQNARLEEISGFDALTWVNGFLEVTDNSSLVSISGFDSVGKVSRELIIADNPSLEEVSGFSSFEGGNSLPEGEGGWLLVENNLRLTRLSTGGTMPAIAYIQIRHNPELKELDLRFLCTPTLYEFDDNPGLTRLPSSVRPEGSDSNLCGTPHTDVWYTVRAMPGLIDLTGLPRVVGATTVDVSDNEGLRSLEGLNALEGVHELRVTGNHALMTVSALDPTADGALTFAGAVLVRENTALETCQLDSLLAQLAVSNPDLQSDVGDNGVECQ